MNAATHTAAHSHTTAAVATPEVTSTPGYRRLGLLLIVLSAVVTYGGLYLALR